MREVRPPAPRASLAERNPQRAVAVPAAGSIPGGDGGPDDRTTGRISDPLADAADGAPGKAHNIW